MTIGLKLNRKRGAAGRDVPTAPEIFVCKPLLSECSNLKSDS